MRRISRGGKIGIGAAAVAVLAIAMAAVVVVPLGPFAHAAPRASASTSFSGKWGSVSRGGSGTKVPKGIKADAALVACANDTNVKAGKCPSTPPGDDTANRHVPKRPASHSAFSGGKTTASAAHAPKVTGLSVTAEGGIKANFNGVSNDDNVPTNGFVLTPPDQGLCVGPAGPLEAAGLALGVSASTTVVVEPVNEAYDIFATNGTRLFGPDSLADLFSNPDSEGDVSCQYDPGTQAYYFTEIGILLSGPDAGNFGTDLAVIDNHGYAPYQIDTSVGGTCFPDFPHQGFDKDAFYVTVNQFDCGPASEGFYAGAMIWGLSKSQLVSEGTVNFITFGPLSLAGTETLAIAPAFGDASGTEYMANSWPYDAFGNDNNVANSLGFWSVTDDNDITNGSGPVTLHGQNISSQTYAFPQQAASTGDGSVNGGGITQEKFLNPDDDRMEQLELLNTPSGLRLYTSLDSAVNISGDPTARDGAAWFVIDPTHASVASQGIVAVAGTYLLYPSFMRGSTGTKVIDFSMTSTTLNPSVGYAFIKDTATSFSSVSIAMHGTAPHFSFSDFFFGEARWGDYSAAALDPTSGDIWVADEYIPHTSTNGFDNWGTRVWDVAGSNS